MTTGFSTTSTPALYLSNWKDIVAIWETSKLAQTDPGVHGPCLRELHYLGTDAAAWSVNQIVDFTAFFRNETSSARYTAAASFDADGWLESGPADAGTLTTRYAKWRGAAPAPVCDISRRYAFVPNMPFVVVRTTIANSTAVPLTWNVLDQLHVNNTQAHAGVAVHASYDPARVALVADMSASGQFFLVLGAFQAMDGFQCGDESVTDPAAPTAAGWFSFDRDGTLRNNADLHAPDVDLAFHKRVTVAPGSSATVDVYLAIAATEADALAAADAARARPAQHWFTAAATATTAWLNAGRRTHVTDTGLNTMFDRALLVTKHAQHPILGTFPATTSPFAYGHLTWVRDGSVTAIALDAAGHHDEAARYFRWMASVQRADGTWWTRYDYWAGTFTQFVEPEHDSVGTFLYGVYWHERLTNDVAFANTMWPVVRKSADWLVANLSPVNGLGAVDFSIWEEPERGLEHNVYTQAWYVLGLVATQAIAELRGDTALADWYAGGVASIMTALQRPSSWYPPGLWNLAGYYNRGVNQDNTIQPLEDSASNVLVAFGVVDHASGRAASHVGTMTSHLTHLGFGLARYAGDNYYYTSQFDPAGDEVGAPEPCWPQMSMWVAMCDVLAGDSHRALQRLEWFASTSGLGYMPQGEAVSNVTRQSVRSSMSEPLTASSFVLAMLAYTGRHDGRIAAPIHNAGARVPIAVHAGTTGDWLQWQNVPYFVANLAAAPTSPTTTIRRVYAANDGTNLYLRVDNVAGVLPGFGVAPAFAVRVYATDGVAPTTHAGLDGKTLARPAGYCVSRRSDEDVFRRYTVHAAAWVEGAAVAGTMPPQWEPATGRVEVVVPLTAIGSPAAGAWTTLTVALAAGDADDGRIVIHYRVSSPSDAWIYGNIEA